MLVTVRAKGALWSADESLLISLADDAAYTSQARQRVLEFQGNNQLLP